jgi:N-acyl-D-aspartate/D-glutamate deacylase
LTCYLPRFTTCSGGLAFQLGACDDNQTAADTASLSQTAYTGAATYCFIDAVERYGVDQNYSSLLAHMTAALKNLGKTSLNKPTAGQTAASMAVPLAMGLTLGPAGLLAGALLAPGGEEDATDPTGCLEDN